MRSPDGDKVKYLIYVDEATKLKLWIEGTRQTLAFLNTKAPVLSAQKSKITKDFPESFSVVDAFDWLEQQYKNTMDGRTKCEALQQKARSLDFTLSTEGMLTYFSNLEEIKDDIDIYNELSDVDDPLTYMQMVARSQHAAIKCGLRVDKVREIDTAWAKERTDNGYTEDTIWIPFMEFYDGKLIKAFKDYGIDLTLTNRPPPTAQANFLTQIEALETSKEELRTRNLELLQDSKTLKANQNELERAYASISRSSSIPSVIGTRNDTMTTGGDTRSHLLTTQCTTVDVNSKGWRQWTFFCFTCGVNLHHNTKDHTNRRGPKRDGHDENHAATPTDLRGGNGDKNWLWKLYCNPVTKRAFHASGEKAQPPQHK